MDEFLGNPGSRQRQPQTTTQLQLLTPANARPNTSDDIERLLSSSFYPGASPDYSRHHPTPSNSTGSAEDNGESLSYEQQTIHSQDTQHISKNNENDTNIKNKKKSPVGTKRKADTDDNDEPGERRRKQIREAQRAYRQRKISQTAFLEERVKQLEGAIENMSSVVLSFSEELIGSNILSCQSDLTSRLRDALATCLTLVRETGSGALEEPTDIADMAVSSPRASTTATYIVPSIPLSIHGKPPSIKSVFGNKPYPDMNTSMTVAAFMDMVATSAVYYGYLALADPTLTTTRLYRHFGLPLQLMDRDKLLSYFSALFQARLSRTRLCDFPNKPGMPFFSIGGAGTHYSPALSTAVASGNGQAAAAPLSLPWANAADQCSTWSPRNNSWTIPMDTSNVPTNLQDRFEGDWFDMQDLELYLLESGVSLRMKPNSQAKGDINVPLFLRGLMSNTTCLGQSPGFRRHDVERALQAAQCRPQA